MTGLRDSVIGRLILAENPGKSNKNWLMSEKDDQTQEWKRWTDFFPKGAMGAIRPYSHCRKSRIVLMYSIVPAHLRSISVGIVEVRDGEHGWREEIQTCWDLGRTECSNRVICSVVLGRKLDKKWTKTWKKWTKTDQNIKTYCVSFSTARMTATVTISRHWTQSSVATSSVGFAFVKWKTDSLSNVMVHIFTMVISCCIWAAGKSLYNPVGFRTKS